MKSISRRTFLGTATLAALQPRFAIGQEGESANAKLNIALIGAGGMARAAVEDCRDENFVAFCDVDDRRCRATYRQYPYVPTFKDFQSMMDTMEKEIDAVVVSTPDHTHFAAAMDCMQRGKHVYVQKPLAHNIWQVRTLQKAAHNYGVVTQMGNQGHASDGIRVAKEWYQAGVLGEVREAHVWTDRPKLPWFEKPETIPPEAEPVPKALDWDLWQGPTSALPATKYAVLAEGRSLDGGKATCSVDGSFKTAALAKDPAPVHFTVVTGQEYYRRDDDLRGHKIYPVMQALDPDFFVHTDDIEYYDKAGPYADNQELARFKWNRLFSVSFQRDFHNHVGSYFMKDDHDTLKNDSWPGQRYGDLTFEQVCLAFIGSCNVHAASLHSYR